MKVEDGDTFSDALAGQGKGNFAERVLESFGGFRWLSGEGLKEAFQNVGSAIKQGWNFITGWFREDPVGAIAAVGLISLGVVLVVGGGGAVAAIGGGVIAAVKLGLGVLGITSFVAPDLLRGALNWLIGGVANLYYFNWNTTDNELNAQIQALQNMLWGVFGESLGEALGAVVCGVLPGMALVKVNPKLFAKIALMLGDGENELFDTIKDAFNNFIAVAAQAGLRMLGIQAYKNLRRFVKTAAQGLPLPTGIQNAIQNWGSEGSQPWSFAQKVEEFIESIPDVGIQQFLEGLTDGFLDGCLESAIVLNSSW